MSQLSEINSNDSGQDIGIQPPPLPEEAKLWSTDKPHPWRRYFARAIVDYAMNLLVIGIIFISPAVMAASTGTDSEINSGGMLIEFVALFFSPFLNALFIGYTGSSPGKWLFGIKVLDSEGKPIGWWRAFKREWRIIIRAFAIGIPIVSFITMIVAYRSLSNNGITSWDRDANLIVLYRKMSATKCILSMLSFIVLVGSIFGAFTALLII